MIARAIAASVPLKWVAGDTETGIGWQHWFSPQIEIRPEVSYYKSLDAFAFNGNANFGIAPNKNYAIIAAADMIIHF